MSFSKKTEPQPVVVKGHALTCPVCGNSTFHRREAQLNTSLATFFNLDWANRTATCYVCPECTYIYWFLEA